MFNTLLVEDNVSFRRALVDILRTHVPLIGVNEAGCGEEALRKIEQLRPGLIFMDIQLPKENGLEVTREIKLVYHDIVIVVLTSCELSEFGTARTAFFQSKTAPALRTYRYGSREHWPGSYTTDSRQ
jgi:CheY-like chemotaxis protein